MAMLCCGLFVAESDKSVPLISVHYDVNVRGFAGSITINQTYKNCETTDLECVYGFPMNDQAAVTGFVVKIDDRVLTSQFKKKDDAFKEYTEALQKGHGAYLLDQADRSDDSFVLSVGRLPPGKECVVSISYVCTLDSITETKQRLVIPMALFPRYDPYPGSAAGAVAPPEKYASSVPHTATLDAKIQALEQIKSVSSVSHPISVNLIGPDAVQVTFGTRQQPLNRDLIIDIEIKNNPEHHVLVEQIDGDRFVGMYSFVPKFDDEEKIQSELIFVVDCSGSMQGAKIEDATRAMQIFLRSIPEGCYFNFYRFGSSFQSLFDKSKPYGKDTFKAAQIYANATSANLGGTEILSPLKNIFSVPPLSGFSRQLFVLTDGEVSNTEEVIDLVKKNASNSRVFSFGIGDSCSRSLVNGIALAGNGKAEYCKYGEVLEDKIGRHLERALQPAVVQANILWEGLESVQQVPYVLPPVFRGDRQIAYAFFDIPKTEQNSKVILQLKNKETQTNLQFPVTGKREQGHIAQLAARALIKFLETAPAENTTGSMSGSLQHSRVPESQLAKLEPKKSNGGLDNKVEIMEISLKYGVMSKYVSLLAVEKRDGAAAQQMQLREIPVQVSTPDRYRSASFSASYQTSLSGCNTTTLRTLSASSFGPRQMKKASLLGLVKGILPKSTGKQKTAWSPGTESFASRSAEPEMAADGSAFRSIPKSFFEDLASNCARNADRVETLSSRPNSAEATDFNPNSLRKPVLNQVLDLQQWDGSWEYSANLERLLGVSKDTVQRMSAEKLDSAILGTLLVVAFLNAKHANVKHIWQAIAQKASVFVLKHISKEKQSSLLISLQASF